MFIGTFFTITDTDITKMLGYVGDLVEDLTPLMLPVIAIGLGVFIFWAIITAIRGK